MMRWQEYSAPGRGVQLHVRRVVEPTAPPIILLHGLGVAGSVWQAFARRLLPRLAAVAPDLRGHGQSDAPPTGYTPADYAADIAELISTGLTPAQARASHSPAVPIAGHSLGALVALAVADLWPRDVGWLVLLDPPLDASLSNSEVPQVYRLRQARPGELENYLLERNPGGGRLLAEQLARLFRQASDAAFETMLDRAVRTAPVVGQPTLVLQADPNHGGVLGDAAAQAFVAQLPHGQLIKIPGATHALHASHPAEVASAILDFAERQPMGAVSST